jgi:hypothetical protein
MTSCTTGTYLQRGKILYSIQRLHLDPNKTIFSLTMMKFAALALLASSASAFAPAQQSARAVTSLAADKSASLPFMNRPELVSLL